MVDETMGVEVWGRCLQGFREDVEPTDEFNTPGTVEEGPFQVCPRAAQNQIWRGSRLEQEASTGHLTR